MVINIIGICKPAQILYAKVCFPSCAGTNFEILPELTWGVDKDHIGQPPGYPTGYMFFWTVTAIIALVHFIILRHLKVF